MGRFEVLIAVLDIVLTVWAVADLAVTDDSRIPGLPKVGWILACLLFVLVGPIAWMIVRRKQRPLPRRGASPQPRRAAEPKAPDDDPEFLSRVDKERLQRWEDDLLRRERELGHPQDPEQS